MPTLNEIQEILFEKFPKKVLPTPDPNSEPLSEDPMIAEALRKKLPGTVLIILPQYHWKIPMLGGKK